MKRKNMSNPYQRGGGSPLQNPLVLVGGAVFLIIVIFTMLSSDSNSSIEDEHAKLRSASSGSEMTEKDLNKLNKPEGKDDLQLQQNIVPGEEREEKEKTMQKDDYGNYITSLDDDIYLQEALRISADYIRLSKKLQPGINKLKDLKPQEKPNLADKKSKEVPAKGSEAKAAPTQKASK